MPMPLTLQIEQVVKFPYEDGDASYEDSRGKD